MSPQEQRAELGQTWDIFAGRKGDVIEMRILDVPWIGTVAGYFNDRNAFIEAALERSGKGSGTYITQNPVDPRLLARANNRLIPNAKKLTGDADVIRRRRFTFDLDSLRPSS